MRRFVTSFIFFCVFIPVVSAQSVHVVTEDWPPFNYLDENGVLVGLATTNVEQVLAHSQLDYSFNVFPWARSYHLARRQKNTLIYSIYRTPQREAAFHWFCPITETDRVFLYRRSDDSITLRALEDAEDFSIGVMRDDNSHQYLRQAGLKDGQQLDVSADEVANLRKLLAGRVDMIVHSESSLPFRLKQLGIDASALTPVIQIHPELKNAPCMALSINSDKNVVAELTRAFNQWQKRNSDE